MREPSRRKGAYFKGKNPHQSGKVACALFAKFRGEANARALGNDKWSNPKASWKNHAEPQWWDDPANQVAFRKAAIDPYIEQFEFEVSVDFCSSKCRDLFKQARFLAPKAKIYIFITRQRLDPQGTVIKS